ncbi:MAG: GNAT family N-acetyltransferase [Chloroflexi bacterium]|nr:GNAT family N-acetyltransferase [Chloroflexota bacterium]
MSAIHIRPAQPSEHELLTTIVRQSKTHWGYPSDVLFHPSAIGKGVGRQAFEFTIRRATEMGHTILRWESEPHAVQFCRHMDAEQIGERPSSYRNHALALMQIDLYSEISDT